MTICQLKHPRSVSSIPSLRVCYGAASNNGSRRRSGASMTASPHERAQALARMALALMAERQVAPTPDNFQLFYTYVAGDSPAVTRILSDLISARRVLTPELLADIRNRLFSTAPDRGGLPKHRLRRFPETVTTMLARLETAQRDAVAYGHTLSAASGELDDVRRRWMASKQLVGGLVARPPARWKCAPRISKLNCNARPAKSTSCARRETRRRAQGKLTDAR